MSTITHIVMDIEGTVAPIEFVHQNMFSYIRNNIDEYIRTTMTTDQTQADIGLLIAQSQSDVENNITNITPITIGIDTEDKDELRKQVVANVISQMDIDRKIGALKTLQGHIWHQAFTSGELVAELYDDVFVMLDKWTNVDKKTLAIYSSGSVGAQKLLFSHTKKGDLTPLFTGGFYDTVVGFKREKQSYINILEKLQITDTPQSCMFLTDIYEEAVAAKEAGIVAILVIRPGNYPVPENHGFKTVTSFEEL